MTVTPFPAIALLLPFTLSCPPLCSREQGPGREHLWCSWCRDAQTLSIPGSLPLGTSLSRQNSCSISSWADTRVWKLEITGVISAGERGGSFLVPLLYPELTSSPGFWIKPISRRNPVGSCQELSNPVWLPVHPQSCCGEAEVLPSKLCAAGTAIGPTGTASSCVRGGLGWILGKGCSPRG